jgi:DNA repair exonuclease SbcCD ATPase subunit
MKKYILTFTNLYSLIQEISKELENLKKDNALIHEKQEELSSQNHKIDEEKLESRLKQSAITAIEKRLDKVASSILSAVDQKLNKDSGLQQKLFNKLDEKLNKVESDLTKKSIELTNLMNSKIMSSRTETNETIQDLQRTYKIIVEPIDAGQEQNSKTTQSFKSRLEQHEQVSRGLRKDMDEFTSGIVEDVEQLRAQINSIAVKPKPKDLELTKEEINDMLSMKIPEYLQNYAKKSEITDVRTYVDTHLTQTNNNVSATASKISEIPDQIYRNLAQSLSEINDQWDSKFDKTESDFTELRQGVFDDLNKYESNLKTMVESNAELVERLQTELSDLKSVYCSIGTKATELQNNSNLIDTKHETGSKFYSNEKLEKNKDIEVNEQSENSYQEFKVSPVKGHQDYQMHDTKHDSDFKDKNHEIEDSSMFGLSPTPQMPNKGFSRTQKQNILEDEDEDEDDVTSMIINEDAENQSLYNVVLERNQQNSPNIQTKGKFNLRIIINRSYPTTR